MSARILIADDERNIVTALRFVLEHQGYEVQVAENGLQAMELMHDFAPQLVLLDVMMPGMNGFDVCQKIRENPAWAATRVVMLSAKGRDLDIAKGLALGADAYISKPFSTRELQERIRALLAGDATAARVRPP